MQTHSEFSEWEEVQEGVYRRHSTNSMNNMRYGKVIQVQIDGDVYTVEPENVSRWYKVKNGPLFFGETHYRTQGEVFKTFEDVIGFLVARHMAHIAEGRSNAPIE